MMTSKIAMSRITCKNEGPVNRPFSREAGWRAGPRAGACGGGYLSRCRCAKHVINDLIAEQFYFRLIERNLLRPDVVRHIGRTWPQPPHAAPCRTAEMELSMIRVEA